MGKEIECTESGIIDGLRGHDYSFVKYAVFVLFL